MASFERAVGFVNAYLRNSKGAYTTPQLRKILAVYPDLNLNWLITGEGSMLQTEDSPQVIAAKAVSAAMAAATAKAQAEGTTNLQLNQGVHNAVQDGNVIDIECDALSDLIKSIDDADNIDLAKVPKAIRWLIKEFQERGKRLSTFKKADSDCKSEARQLKKENDRLQKENSDLREKLEEARDKADDARDKLIALYSKIHDK